MTTTPSFELGQDHLDLQEWVHTFAADVIRPAAAEWDEKEEFPWPVVEEAAKAGLYSVDFIVAQAMDETGLGFPISMEELFWGDAGIGLSIVGTSLAAAGRTTSAANVCTHSRRSRWSWPSSKEGVVMCPT